MVTGLNSWLMALVAVCSSPVSKKPGAGFFSNTTSLP
jgi:hypothetical protein